jgi:hypothetical protein
LECFQGGSLCARRELSHDLDDMLTVKRQDFIDGAAEADERRDDRAGARSKDQIEPLMQRPGHGLNLLQHAERVEAFCSAAVQAQDATAPPDIGTSPDKCPKSGRVPDCMQRSRHYLPEFYPTIGNWFLFWFCSRFGQRPKTDVFAALAYGESNEEAFI